MGTHLTIHQFSRLSGIPAKLLRYYDSREILQPDLRDEKTGYRYYRPSQVARANRIKLLRDAGLGLEEIRELERLESHRKTRKAREFIREQERDLEQRLQNILLTGQYLKSLRIETVGSSNNVKLIQMPTLRAALKSYTGLHNEVVAAMVQFREDLLAEGLKIVGDPVLIREPERRSRDSTKNSTIAIPVLGKKFKLPGVTDGAISGGTLAAIDCRGDTKKLGDTYEKLFGWCYEAGFVVSGPIRESYPIEERANASGPRAKSAKIDQKTGKKAIATKKKTGTKSRIVKVLAPVQVMKRAAK